MATDWAADVKKYAPKADDNVIAGIVRYCGIALTKVDSSLVAMSDKKETDRVRENFLKKKLGRTETDSALDAAIQAVGETMKADRTKNRVTVYYLLADKFDSLHLFLKASNAKAKAPAKAAGTKAAAKPKAKAAGAAAAAGGAALGLAALGDKGNGAPAANDDGAGAKAAAALGAVGAAVTGAASAAADTAETAAGKVGDAAGAAGAAVVGAAGAAAAGAAALASGAGSAVSGGVDRVAGAASGLVGGDDEGSGNWLWWLLAGLLALFAIWYFFLKGPDTDGAAPTATTTEAAATTAASAAAPTDLASAPAEGTVAIPAGAGVTSELRDGKPVVKVYFASGKTEVVPDFGPAAGGLKAYLAANTGAKLAITGYADPTGNAARNAELSKQRAQAVQASLVAAGIPIESTEMVKPASATDATVNLAAARRVEVTVK